MYLHNTKEKTLQTYEFASSNHSWPKPSLHRIGSFFLASILTLQLQQTTASRKSSSVPLQKKTFKQTELTKPYTTLTCFSYLYSSTCSKTLALCLLVQVLFKTSGPIQEMKYPTKSGLQNNRPSKFDLQSLVSEDVPFEKNANWIELISNVFWRLFDDGYIHLLKFPVVLCLFGVECEKSSARWWSWFRSVLSLPRIKKAYISTAQSGRHPKFVSNDVDNIDLVIMSKYSAELNKT